jgi:hypothetical protein
MSFPFLTQEKWYFLVALFWDFSTNLVYSACAATAAPRTRLAPRHSLCAIGWWNGRPA